MLLSNIGAYLVGVRVSLLLFTILEHQISSPDERYMALF
jgi:hypothetical protein